MFLGHVESFLSYAPLFCVLLPAVKGRTRVKLVGLDWLWAVFISLKFPCILRANLCAFHQGRNSKLIYSVYLGLSFVAASSVNQPDVSRLLVRTSGDGLRVDTSHKAALGNETETRIMFELCRKDDVLCSSDWTLPAPETMWALQI